MLDKVVYHPTHGKGVARVRFRGGLEYQVRFDSGQHIRVRVDELKLIGEAPALVPPPSDEEVTALPTQCHVERKVIEALRLGIVPDEGLSLFTFGRENEIQNLERWLVEPRDPVRTIVGSYGSGKTHLLNYFRLRALEAGYAVSLVQMDPQENPFSKPKRVYSSITRTLQWKDGARIQGFRHLIERGLRDGILDEHLYFGHLRRNAADEDWIWISGDSGTVRPSTRLSSFESLPGIYDYRTAANIFCYLISGIGWTCLSRALKLKGLLILFDESESLYAARGQSMDYSVNFLEALIATAHNQEALTYPAKYAKKYEYARNASDIPFLYRLPSGLKLVFAFTSLDELEMSQSLVRAQSIQLQPLATDELTQMITQLFSTYQNAYEKHGLEIDAKVALRYFVNHYTHTGTRSLVKGLVEVLDYSCFYTLGEDEERDDDW